MPEQVHADHPAALQIRHEAIPPVEGARLPVDEDDRGSAPVAVLADLKIPARQVQHVTGIGLRLFRCPILEQLVDAEEDNGDQQEGSDDLSGQPHEVPRQRPRLARRLDCTNPWIRSATARGCSTIGE
jgi:hypothetical protein